MKLKTLLPSILAISLLGLATYVSTLLYANVSSISAQNKIKTWQKAEVLPDAEALQEVFETLQLALKFDPNNPEYLNSAAGLSLYKARLYPLQSPQAKEANHEALASYRHLLTLRPAWPFYWASIIHSKYELWEYDREMQQALSNTARLGPLFKSNQHTILRAGYLGWYFIDIETREAVNNTLERAMQIQPQQTIALSLEQGFSDRLQPYIEGDETLTKMYENQLKKMHKGKR